MRSFYGSVTLFAACLVLGGCADATASLREPHRSPRAQVAAIAESGGETSTGMALGQNPTLEEYLQFAAVNNPGLRAALGRWQAAVDRVPQARSLPDPMVGYMYMTKPRAMRQRQAVEFSQTLPWFGKLDAQGEAAMAAAEAERYRYEAATLKLFYDVKVAYYEYYYLGRAIATLTEDVELIRQLEQVTRTRYSVGTAGHPDIIRLQMELARLENRLRSLEDLRSPIMARLNLALGRDAAEQLPVPVLIEKERPRISDAELHSLSLRQSPELQGLQAEIDMERRETELAQKKYYPDVTFGLQVADATAMDDRPREDVYTVSVMVNLPLWRERLAAGVSESQARVRSKAAEKIEKTNVLGYDLKMAVYGYHDAVRRQELYSSVLLQKARESFEATLRAYETGQSSFSDLIDTQRLLLEFRLEHERAITDAAVKLAEVRMLVGDGI